MDPKALKNYMNALETVKQSHTCGICSELCRNPVTLSICLHTICGEHFEGLKTCPDCGTSLEGCTVYLDDRLERSIEATRELHRIFDAYRTKDNRQPATRPTSENTPNAPTETLSKRDTIEKSSKTKVQSKSNPNVSLTSSSSKFSKAIEKRNKKGETILHISCRLGNIGRVSEVLCQGANTNTKDNAGWTPLHEVVQNGRIDIVKLLLQHNTLINVPGQSNETPLHEAIRYGHKDIAEVLVMNGADINARNCKGETPFDLASPEMKNVLLAASDKVIQTQSVNIAHMSAFYSEQDFYEIRVYCISQFRTVHNKLKLLVKNYSNLHLEAKLTNKVTHLIVDAEDNGVCESNLDILQGVAYSLWILTSKWVTKSNEDELEKFEPYEVTGIGTQTYQGPRNSRYNKYKQLPGIFDGCHFYFHNFNVKYEITKNIVVTKQILTKLVTDAGGVALRRVPNPELIPEEERLVPYHAKKGGKLVNCSHYIVFKDMYEPMYNMQHLKALPIGWLIECLEKYELCEPW